MSATTNPTQASDISWAFVVSNYIAITAVSYVIPPSESAMSGFDPAWYPLIRVGALAAIAGVVVGIATLFRRDKELAKKRRSFVIASWVFLILSIWGAMPKSSAPQQVQSDPQPQPQPQAITEATPVDPSAELLQLRLSTMTDQEYQDGSAYWLSQHKEYATKEWIEALGRELQQVVAQYPAIALGPALDMALQRQVSLATNAVAPQSVRSRTAEGVQCGSDQVLSDSGVCTTIVDPYRPDVQNPFDPFNAQPVTVSEDQVARINGEQNAAFEASRARRQARQDMQDAAAEALRGERRRNDDY
jgi:hypothetical protein